MNIIDAWNRAGQNQVIKTKWHRIIKTHTGDLMCAIAQFSNTDLYSNEWEIETPRYKFVHHESKLHFALQVLSGRIDFMQLLQEKEAVEFHRAINNAEMKAIAEDIIYQAIMNK
jgi:tellurite resistance-related uncharacterized protein